MNQDQQLKQHTSLLHRIQLEQSRMHEALDYALGLLEAIADAINEQYDAKNQADDAEDVLAQPILEDNILTKINHPLDHE